jgi:hypothetical protein
MNHKVHSTEPCGGQNMYYAIMEPHLRSAALDLAWYQYLLLDVAAFLFLLVAITVLISYLILKNVYRYLTAQYYKVKCKHD